MVFGGTLVVVGHVQHILHYHVSPQVAVCRSDAILDNGGQPSEFELEYDTLVMAIGEQPATFGVPGVQEHCFYMKVCCT